MNDETSDPSIEPKPSQFTDWYGFDTENDETGKVTITALVHESGEQWIWDRAGKLVEWCEQQTGSPVVICHNLEYDLVNEFGTKQYAEMSLNYLKGRLISAKYGRVRFLDSFNHFRMSLLKLGEAIGINKKVMDIYSPEYVTTDAWICLKAMTQARDYIASLGGRMGATSGSSSLSVWEYMTDAEYFTGPIDTPWMRRGYYGGRTEIFRPVTEGRRLPDGSISKDIRGYDINSMYPFCMMNDFPEYLMDDPGMNKAKGMVEATVSLPHDLFVAPLPHRSSNDRLLYPVGVMRGVWTYDEVRLAERMGGRVIKVHRGVGCNALVRPFDQFIRTLYRKRKASTNDAERLFLKVLMNSLYGKIASRNVVTRTVSRHHLLKSKQTKRLAEVTWINYHRGLLDYFTPQQAYVNVCWGSMITAYARNLLFTYLVRVPPDKLIYCDTDSIYCIDHELPESPELGGMKLEQTASVMKVIQPKAYQLDDFYKAKGVPKPKYGEDGKISIDFARQYIEEGFTEFQAPIRFRASLNSRKGKANEWVKHSKGRRSAYTNKILAKDRYLPPVLGEQMELAICITKGKSKKHKQ